MKILDWYIIRKFLGTYVFINIVLMLIAVIFDVSEKVDDFLKNDAPIGEILVDYYFNFIIYYSNLFSSLIIFITVIWFTSKMATNVEIVAILSSGVSFMRFLRPYFIAATLLTIISLWFNHYLLPDANVTRLAFEESYIKNPYRFKHKNVHREPVAGTIVSFQHYNASLRTARQMSIEEWENGRLQYKIMADRGIWDTVENHWRLEGLYKRNYRPDGTHHLEYQTNLDTVLQYSPKNFATRNSFYTSMNSPTLLSEIKEMENAGDDRLTIAKLELHQRTSYPVATYILTLIGVSIASRKLRGGIGVHLALGFLVVLIYIFSMKITTVAATNAGLAPIWAVWIPNFVFAGIGLILYSRAQK